MSIITERQEFQIRFDESHAANQRFAESAARRLSELTDRLRDGCHDEDCLAIRDAAHNAAELVSAFNGVETVLPLCRVLERPSDDWRQMLELANRLRQHLEAFERSLRGEELTDYDYLT